MVRTVKFLFQSVSTISKNPLEQVSRKWNWNLYANGYPFLSTRHDRLIPTGWTHDPSKGSCFFSSARPRQILSPKFLITRPIPRGTSPLSSAPAGWKFNEFTFSSPPSSSVLITFTSSIHSLYYSIINLVWIPLPGSDIRLRANQTFLFHRNKNCRLQSSNFL